MCCFNIKNTPDLAYTNEVKNSVTKIVPLGAVDGGIQGGTVRIPNTTGSTVLEEITINASKAGYTNAQLVQSADDENDCIGFYSEAIDVVNL